MSWPLKGTWYAAFAVQGIVQVVLLARWAGSGRWEPPHLMVPFLIGTLGILGGLSLQGLPRLAAWLPSWAALGFVIRELVTLQATLSRGLPGLYALVYVGVSLLAAACLAQLWADR